MCNRKGRTRGTFYPALRQGRIQQARQDYLKGLREKARAPILLRSPKIEVHADPAGCEEIRNPQAPITIVDFSDYECPIAKVWRRR